jgi:hypothetical protein
MQRSIKILKYGLVFLMISFFAISGCVASKKNPWSSKKSKASQVNSSQLGRNKYYFSVGYQKKLTKSYKK